MQKKVMGFHTPPTEDLQDSDNKEVKNKNKTPAAEEPDIFGDLSPLEIIKKCGETRMSLDKIENLLRPRLPEMERKALLFDLLTPGTPAANAYAEGAAEADYLINASMLSNAQFGEGRDAAEALKALDRQSVGDKVTKALKENFGLDA